jgi:molybdate transport system substrate-binding protein
MGQPTVGKIDTAIASGVVADLVILPPSEFAGMAGKLRPGSEKKVGRVIFGVAVKSGAPHPDISSMEKFRAALKGKRVAYNDPAIGSLAGKMVDAMLKTSDYADVIRVPAHTTGGQAVADGAADITIAVVSEELKVKGIDIIGPVPDATGLSIDISGAVLTSATHPVEAASFLDYLRSPEAAPILTPIGIAPP